MSQPIIDGLLLSIVSIIGGIIIAAILIIAAVLVIKFLSKNKKK